MTWFKVDDRLAFHQKVLRAGNAAMGAWVRLGSWSSANETDGKLTSEIVQSIATPEELKRLLDVVLLEEKPGGAYEMHDFLHYNPSSKRLNKQRKQWAGQKKRQRTVSTTDTQVDSNEDSSPDSPSSPSLARTRASGRDGIGSESGSDPEGSAEGGLREQLARAYADGIADGSGQPWRMPDANIESGVIIDAVTLYAANLRGEKLTGWVKRSAATYRRAMGDRAEYQRGFRPAKWLEWLGAGGEKMQRRVVGNVPAIVQRDEGTPEWAPKEA